MCIGVLLSENALENVILFNPAFLTYTPVSKARRNDVQATSEKKRRQKNDVVTTSELVADGRRRRNDVRLPTSKRRRKPTSKRRLYSDVGKTTFMQTHSLILNYTKTLSHDRAFIIISFVLFILSV